MQEMEQSNKSKAVGLIPFLVFIVIYLGGGLYFQYQAVPMAFYQIPGPVAIACGIIVAFLIFKGSMSQKVHTFVTGCGNNNIITMCLIYLLAGGFSAVARATGAVEATANLGLALISPDYIAVGVFLITMFLALATGTSVGSIVAMGPIAVELAGKSGVPLPIMLAAIMGGAMWGDDLSLISDTTIAATRTQGVNIRDQFKANIAIATPAVIITLVLLFMFGRPDHVFESTTYETNFFRILPYLMVLTLALAGLNVFSVLTLGIIASIAIGLFYKEFSWVEAINELYSGFLGMIDIFLLSMLTGGLARMVAKAGGINWVLMNIQKMIKGRKSAELGIGLLVGTVDLAVANNTVAIVITGDIAKKLSEQNGVDPRRSAGLLSIFSCIAQGVIPYGAQMLILISFTNGAVSPLQLIPMLWYQQLLLLSVIISIFIPFYRPFLKDRVKVTS